MTRFTLECYLVNVLDRDNQDMPLSDFSNSQDLYEVFIRYLEERDQNLLNNPDQNKMFRVTRYEEEEEEHLVRGIIKIGNYGLSAELIDIELGEKTYDRSPTEAEMMPYYFLAYLPGNSNRGVVILQKNSGRGIQTSLFTDFRKHTKNFNNNVRVDFNSFIPGDFIDELTKNARWTKIRFLRNDVPKRIHEAYQQEAFREGNQISGFSEFVIQPARNQNFPAMVLDWAIGALRDKSKVPNMAEVIGHDYDNVKMEIELGGRKMTINLERLDALKTDFDITEEVLTNEGGHPRFDSIDSAAKKLLNSIILELSIRRN